MDLPWHHLLLSPGELQSVSAFPSLAIVVRRELVGVDVDVVVLEVVLLVVPLPP
jgi:hypothetical protein